MEIIAGTTDFYLEKDTAVAIGKFDGVHLGHRRLLEEILGRKKYGLAACVFTFDPTPAVLFGLSDGKELTTREEKRRLFERLGIDTLIEIPLTKETAATEPERFATEILAKQMNTRFVAAGEDLSFGKNGAGNAELLERMAPHLGFCVQTIEKIEVDGIEVSSTYIRKLVEGVGEHGYELDEYISKYAIGWKFQRIPRIAAAIMRVAMFEVLYMPEIPASAAINEAVELAKKYDEPKVASFVNGILGSFVRKELSGGGDQA